MSRATESGAYLGGISTMLAQSDVCPACGRTHSARRVGFLGSSKGGCPLVVFGTLPALTRAVDFEEPNGSELVPDLPMPPIRLERLTSDPPLPAIVPTRKGGFLTVPWPMPSHLEDYL